MITKPKVGDIIRDTNDSEGGLVYRVIEDNMDRMLLECIDGHYYPLKIAPRQTIDLPTIMADFVTATEVFVMADSNNRKAATAIEADKMARSPKGPHGWINVELVKQRRSV